MPVGQCKLGRKIFNWDIVFDRNFGIIVVARTDMDKDMGYVYGILYDKIDLLKLTTNMYV